MIRKVDSGQYPELVGIWEAAVLATHDFLSREDFLAIRTRLPEYFDYVDIYAYEKDGKLFGFIGVADGNIEMLFVSERGTGIGSKLLAYAIENLGAGKVDVNEQNTAARGFYESRGFVVVGRSEKDSEGRDYPILHLELKTKD